MQIITMPAVPGTKMLRALQIVKDSPGCSKLDIATAISPYGTTRYGYVVVDRCIRYGLITADRQAAAYRLQITDAGLAVLGQYGTQAAS